jgi:hypothetical protein
MLSFKPRPLYLPNPYYRRLDGPPSRYVRCAIILTLSVIKIHSVHCFLFLWLYSPILGLGRLRETLRFISVTRSSRQDSLDGWSARRKASACLPRVIVMMEKLVEWTVLAGETEVFGENMPRRHFFQHKPDLPRRLFTMPTIISWRCPIIHSSWILVNLHSP